MGKTLSQKTIDEIYKLYDKTKGNANAAADIIRVSHQTVISYWLKKGMNPKGKQNKRTPLKNYRGFATALNYFKEHTKLHSLSRNELALRDSGLYRTLYREGNLEKAIPKTQKGGKRPLSDSLVKEIIKNYDQSGGKVRVAAENTGFSRPTILKYWKRENLPPK